MYHKCGHCGKEKKKKDMIKNGSGCYRMCRECKRERSAIINRGFTPEKSMCSSCKKWKPSSEMMRNVNGKVKRKCRACDEKKEKLTGESLREAERTRKADRAYHLIYIASAEEFERECREWYPDWQSKELPPKEITTLTNYLPLAEAKSKERSDRVKAGPQL